MHSLSVNIKNNALSLLQQGLSVRKVADKCQISKSSVQKLRKKVLPNLCLPSSGRPTKLSAQNKRFCIRAITSGGLETSVKVAKKIEDDLNVKVSSRTVRRALHEAGFEAMEKQEKPKLSSKNIKARLAFAKQHQSWTINDWKRVIWSDETKINRFCSDGRSWCWVGDGESLQPRHVKQTVKHGGGSVVVWGCMTAYGPGFLCKIDGTMYQYLYKQILEEDLYQTMEWYGLNPEQVIFQHDNDSKHKARTAQNWLKEQEFETLVWPPQSPDLNPIEHLWALLKKRLNQYERPSNGMIELWERIQTEWNKIDKEACVKLIESMPNRINSVLKAKGMWTDY